MADKDDDQKPRSAARAGSKIDDNLWNEIVQEWLTNSVKNSAVAQTGESWNGLIASLPSLKAILERQL